MKKNLVRKVLSMLISAIMLVSLAACSKKTGDNNNNSNPTNVPDSNVGNDVQEEDEFSRPFDKYIQDEVAVDLGGYVFKVVDFHDHRWQPEEISSPLDELVVAIIEDVEKTFNCDIVFEQVPAGQLFSAAQPVIMSGDKYADLIGTTMWEFGTLLGANLVADLNTVETLNLNSEYWNKNVAETASFGKSTYAFGGPFGSHLGNYWVTHYNKRIWDELGLPDAAELVEKGEWTWSKFLEYSKLALRDNDGDGLISSEKDRYGVTAPTGDLIQSIFFGLGGKYYKNVDDGTGNIVIRMACTDSASADKIDAMYKFYQNDNVLYVNENLGYLEMFAAGKSLFCCYGNGSFQELKDMEDDFGILPMPKWNTAQEEYICAPDHNAPVFCMTSSNKNKYEAGIIIEALGKRYQAYDEMDLEDRDITYWRLEDDKQIVENYVAGHGTYDISNMIKNANENFNLPAKCVFEGCFLNMYSDIVSTIKAFEDPVTAMLDEFFMNLSK